MSLFGFVYACFCPNSEVDVNKIYNPIKGLPIKDD